MGFTHLLHFFTGFNTFVRHIYGNWILPFNIPLNDDAKRKINLSCLNMCGNNINWHPSFSVYNGRKSGPLVNLQSSSSVLWDYFSVEQMSYTRLLSTAVSLFILVSEKLSKRAG